MLRTVPRSICLAARPSRPSSGKSCTASILRERATQPSPTAGRSSVRSWASTSTSVSTSTSRPGSAGRAGQQATLPQQSPSSSTAVPVLVRSKSSMASSAKWEPHGLPVAPLMRGSQALPPNLTLAQEAWPEQGEEGQGDDEAEDEDGGFSVSETAEGDFPEAPGASGDATDASDEPLSEEDLRAMETLLDIPGLTGTSLDVEVKAWADGAPVGTIRLAPEVFGVPVRRDVVHDVVRWQLAKRRSGNGQTKSIAEVSGSGRKVRPQKGGGIARAGHSRPPHWRGGAKAHGPRRRDFSFKLNKKFVKLGLRVALSARLREGQLTVVDDLKSDSFSTSEMIKTIKARGIDGDVTFVVGGDPQTEFIRSTTNIIGVKVLAARGANVYDIIKRPHLVLSQGAVEHLEEVLTPR